jgi:hypothetical protein
MQAMLRVRVRASKRVSFAAADTGLVMDVGNIRNCHLDDGEDAGAGSIARAS